ncbi:MAG: response regulator transcription factor [Candidatus Aminicenantales bacterium]
MKKILIIEDDTGLVETLRQALEAEAFETISAEDGEAGYNMARTERVDLIILDLKLPTMDGFEICRKLRAEGNTTPIIFLTGKKKAEIDKVLGLELGGDDYITKPFGVRELIARIHAVLRRSVPQERELEEYSFGSVHLDFKKQVALKNKKPLSLTAKEFALLKLLIIHEGEVVSREMILNKVWGYDRFPTTRTVDTFIHNLRHKLEDTPSSPKHILTVPWSGYKFQK